MRLVLAVFFAAGALAGLAAAAASGGWSAPEPVATRGALGVFGEPHLAAAGTGLAVAAWTACDQAFSGVPEAPLPRCTELRGASWSERSAAWRPLATLSLRDSMRLLDLAVRPDGSAVAAVVVGTGLRLAERRAAATAWQLSVRRFGARCRSVTTAEIALGVRGDAVLAWTCDGRWVQVATRTAGALRWGGDTTIAGSEVNRLDAAVDPSGTSFVAWVAASGRSRLEVAAREGHGRWRKRILARTSGLGAAAVAFNAAGDGVAGWWRPDGDGAGSIEAFVKPRGTLNWSRSRVIARGRVSSPSAAMSSRGQAVVAWSRGVPFDGEPDSIEVATRAVDATSWSRPTTVSSTASALTGLSADSAGGVAVTWLVHAPCGAIEWLTNCGPKLLSVRGPGGSWSEPTAVPAPHAIVQPWKAGHALALWRVATPPSARPTRCSRRRSVPKAGSARACEEHVHEHDPGPRDDEPGQAGLRDGDRGDRDAAAERDDREREHHAALVRGAASGRRVFSRSSTRCANDSTSASSKSLPSSRRAVSVACTSSRRATCSSAIGDRCTRSDVAGQ